MSKRKGLGYFQSSLCLPSCGLCLGTTETRGKTASLLLKKLVHRTSSSTEGELDSLLLRNLTNLVPSIRRLSMSFSVCALFVRHPLVDRVSPLLKASGSTGGACACRTPICVAKILILARFDVLGGVTCGRIWTSACGLSLLGLDPLELFRAYKVKRFW